MLYSFKYINSKSMLGYKDITRNIVVSESFTNIIIFSLGSWFQIMVHLTMVWRFDIPNSISRKGKYVYLCQYTSFFTSNAFFQLGLSAA